MNETIIKDFEQFSKLSTNKRIEGLSDSAHRFMLTYLNDYVAKYEQVSRITFVDYLINKELAPSTKSMLAVMLGKFMFWCEYITESDYKILRKSFRQVQKSWSECVLTDKDVARILHFSSKWTHQLGRIRNPLMIYLMASVGLRVSQLTNLNVSDVTIDKDVIGFRILKLKQIKRDVVQDYEQKNIYKSHKIDAFNIERLLADYLVVRNRFVKDKNALFINEEGYRIKTNYVQKLVSRIGKRLKLNITPHSFRHYVGNRVANSQGILNAAILLGHSNITITQKYVNKNTKDTKDIII